MNFSEIKNALAAQPLFAGKTWKISPGAWTFSPDARAELDALGDAALAFYRATEKLYLASADDKKILRNADLRAPWVAPLLDRGKPPRLVAHQRARALAGTLPPVIRPDLLACADGFALTEFDSVPGGIGLTAFLSRLYDAPNAQKMPELFLAAATRRNTGARIAVAISDEAADYRPEFAWLAADLRSSLGADIVVVRADALEISADGVFSDGKKIDVLYRFFELFDLKNVPKIDALFEAAERGNVSVVPPMRAFQEEKMSLALLHHPTLFPFWKETLGDKNFSLLKKIVPETWIVEPTPAGGLPASAALLAPQIDGRPIRDWRELVDAPRRERDLVLKASGFDENAWGARSVTVGEDASQKEWAAALDNALASARDKNSLYVLQRFRKPARLRHRVFDGNGNAVEADGRARICPYYFVVPAENGGVRAKLGGALCTFCPPDKKIVHGMSDAALIPCAL